MTVSKRLRFEVFRRDGHACRYCGSMAPEVKLTIDHVTPVALGGKDEADNLFTACADCNAGKSSVAPDSAMVADVEADALRWAYIREMAVKEWRRRKEERQEALDGFLEAWNRWTWGGEEENPVPIDPTWDESVDHWIQQGLTIDDLIEFIPKTMQRNTVVIGEKWRYYCGIVWRTLDDIAAITPDILDDVREEG